MKSSEVRVGDRLFHIDTQKWVIVVEKIQSQGWVGVRPEDKPNAPFKAVYLNRLFTQEIAKPEATNGKRRNGKFVTYDEVWFKDEDIVVTYLGRDQQGSGMHIGRDANGKEWLAPKKAFYQIPALYA